MDNLTHTLVGALVAETAARVIPSIKSTLPETTRRDLYLAVMVVGSNLPDLDSLYAGITGGTLGYLLHHRGHTHTVLGAIALAALMFGICRWWLQRRRLPPSPADQLGLALITLLAPLLHLAMDATNEYGVHPFWPFNNDWMYGDAIFIVEPLFWAAAAPLVFLFHGRVARSVIGGILLVGIALSFGTGLVPRPMAVCLTLLTVGLLLIGWRANGLTAAKSGLAAALGIIAMFMVASYLANRQLRAVVAAQFPDALLLDAVLAPLPVNPVCWEIITVQLDGNRYTLRTAMLSLAPAWIPAAQCPELGVNGSTTLALTPVTATDSSALQWNGENTMALGELQRVVQSDCEAAAFTRFARTLWISRSENTWLIGDLRYDREPGLGFAEMELTATTQSPVSLECPRWIPPWTPPRSDLL